MSGKTIELPDGLRVGRGTLRECYHHPADDRYVIKVALAGGEAANRQELRAFKLLQRHEGALALISRCHGLVETSRGEGLVCDCIRDSDGSPARTIWDIIIHERDFQMEEVLAAARGLGDRLYAGGIPLFDLNLKNIVLQRAGGGGYRPYVIDLKGRVENHELIPLSSYFSFFARRKLRRRCNQLLERIVDFHGRRHELQHL